MNTFSATLEANARLRSDGGPLIDVICRDTRNGRVYTLQCVPRDESSMRIEAKHNFAEVLAVLDSREVSDWMIDRPNASAEEFENRFMCAPPERWFPK